MINLSPVVARSPVQMRAFFDEKIAANRRYPGRSSIPQEKRGAMIGMMNRYCGGDDNRKLVISWLLADERNLPDYLTIISSKNYDDATWFAIADWVDSFVDESEGGVWKTQPAFPVEAMLVLAEARKCKPLDVLGLQIDAAIEKGGIIASLFDDNDNVAPRPAVRVAVLEDRSGETVQVREIEPVKARRFTPPPPPPNFED